MNLIPVIQEYQLQEFLMNRKEASRPQPSEGSHNEPLVLSKWFQPLTLYTNFQSDTATPTGQALSISTI